MVSTSPTARLLREAIDSCPLSQREIARRAGLAKPNVLSMMKMGEMKVPIDRIIDLARVLEIEPMTLLSSAILEYNPGMLSALTEVMGLPMTEDEMTLVQFYRAANSKGQLSLEGPLLDALVGVLGLAAQRSSS